jgi:CubicO group peptidase (beta-lactamase class C family)
MDAKLLQQARDYALKGRGSGYVTRQGKLVLAWGDAQAKYDLKSTTKSFGATALGLAVGDGKIALADLASRHHPEVAKAAATQPGWGGKIAIFHLATQTAGFEKPGGYSKIVFEPGTKWMYSDCGPNWLAECVTLAYKRDVAELMFERVFTPIGIARSDLSWRGNAYRPGKISGIPRREFGSGISANVDAMARLGLMYLRNGRWQDKQIIPADFVQKARTTPAAIKGLPVAGDQKYAGASNHYGLLWWNNNDATLKNVPTDAYWTWGLGDSFVFVIPSLDLVVARAGKAWPDAPGGHYAKIAPFLDPIVASIKTPATSRPDRDRPPSGSGR